MSLVDPIEHGHAGRRVLVTGAGQNGELPGVGFATACVLAAGGARVAVLDRDAEAARRTVAHIGANAVAVVGDVVDATACEGAVAEAIAVLGGLDGLVNNVAVGDRASTLEVERARFEELFAINLTSAWQVTRFAAEHLGAGSALVNVSSVGVRARGPGMVYSMAKAALENMGEGLAATLGPRGVRVNTVQVGAIWGSFAAANMPESMREPRRRMASLQTEGTAWDVAHAIGFLLSDAARWISGVTLPVDGGPPYRGPA